METLKVAIIGLGNIGKVVAKNLVNGNQPVIVATRKLEDAKVLAVPISKLTKIYDNIQDLDDVPELLKNQIQHFFERYKELEPGKWVKVIGWGDKAEAKAEIVSSFERAQQK